MTERGFPGFCLSAARGTWLCAGLLGFARTVRIPRCRSTLALRMEQPSSDDVQLGQGRSHFEAVPVLRQSPLLDFAEPEDAFDDAEHMLDLGADSRLIAILRRLGDVALTRPLLATVKRLCRRASPGDRPETLSAGLRSLRRRSGPSLRAPRRPWPDPERAGRPCRPNSMRPKRWRQRFAWWWLGRAVSAHPDPAAAPLVALQWRAMASIRRHHHRNSYHHAA